MIMMIPWIMYTVKYLLKMNQGYSYLITNHNLIEFKPVTLHVGSALFIHLRSLDFLNRYPISLPLHISLITVFIVESV